MRRADPGTVLVRDGTPVAIFVRGIEQPLSSRGTELRDRYLDPGADPPAYR